jgi:la-related protein 1
MSVVQFPLDPIRWQLLGQLEYYLSPQNMASDFFLRQRVSGLLISKCLRYPYSNLYMQMDSRGWIPMALIASFNRVRQFDIG